MCYTVFMPIVCALQMVSRVFVTVLFAIEDIMRLIIHTVHGYISTFLHLFTFLPVCLAMCFAKRYCCSTLNQSGCYPRTASIGWNCIFIIIIICAIFVILYYSHSFEYLLNDFKIKLPCVIFGKDKFIESTNKTDILNRAFRGSNVSQNIDSSLLELEEIFRNTNNNIVETAPVIDKKSIRSKCKASFRKKNINHLDVELIADKSLQQKFDTLKDTSFNRNVCNHNLSTEMTFMENNNTLHVEIKEEDYAKDLIPPLEDDFTNHDFN